MSLRVNSELLEPIAVRGPGPIVSLWRRKTANIFRGVIELRADSNDAATVAGEVRRLVREEFAPGFFVPFAFGAMLRFTSHPPKQEILGVYVDTRSRSRGTWQWLIATDETQKIAYGIHTWLEGYLTPVYAGLLKQLEGDGYKCQTTTRAPDKFFTRIWSIHAWLAKAKAVLLILGFVLSLVLIAGKATSRW